MTQIPIYRAKKIDSDKWLEGYYFLSGDNKSCLFSNNFIYVIDPSALAIHFPDMLDKNKKRIFASLSEDGVGGDIITSIGYQYNLRNKVLIFNGVRGLNVVLNRADGYSTNMIEIIGIHKG